MQFQGYFTVEDLIGRGWLPGTIGALLVRPDKALRGGEDVMHLFRVRRITDLELDPRFHRAQAKAALKPPHGLERVALALEDLKTSVMSRPDLRHAALRRFNLRKGLPANQRRLLTTADEYARMEVDFLVQQLGRIFKLGDRRDIDIRESSDMKSLLKRIAKLYPHLKGECERRHRK